MDCGPQWTTAQIQAAIEYAAHPSAQDQIVAKQLRLETLEKLKQVFANLVKWKDIANNYPKELKVSPIAAIPHKTRKFRAILDLSFAVKASRDILESVNAATTKLSHPRALHQLGLVLPRLFQMVAWTPHQKGPFMFQNQTSKTATGEELSRKPPNGISAMSSPVRFDRTGTTCGPKVPSNGLARKPSLFLHGLRNSPRCQLTADSIPYWATPQTRTGGSHYGRSC